MAIARHAPAVLLPVLLLACGPGSVRRPPTDTSDSPTGDSDTAGLCPADMVHIPAESPFCIDRYEAHLDGHSAYAVPSEGMAANDAGMVPQGYISQVVAAAACAAADKRLCTEVEWERACRGPEEWTYPYGNTYDPDACNDTRDEGHPVVEVYGTPTWSPDEMNDPALNQLDNSLDASGANPDCVSAEGVYDLHGNLHEWVDDPEGTFRGGFYVDAVINGEGCSYRTTAHGVEYHDYSTGFRCCR